MNDNQTVKTYSMIRVLNNRKFGEMICARNEEEARAICRSSGTTFDGEIIGLKPIISGESMMNFISKSKLLYMDESNKLMWNPSAAEQLEAFVYSDLK